MSKEPNIWTTRDGTRIDIDDMTDAHLANTLRYLIRNVDHYRRFLWLRVPRDEIANMPPEVVLARIPQFAGLVAEYRRRTQTRKLPPITKELEP